MTNTTITDAERAQAILDSFRATLDLIDADTAARKGRGGVTQIVANVRSALTFNAAQYAASFDLAWDGPTVPVPGQTNGGE